jgi:peptidoglycan/LPS O-acetylase OafA/YrhL
LSFAWWRRLVANRLLVFLSLISYNVYLWHALVMEWLVLRGLRPENYKAPFADGAWKLGYVATALGITLLVSIAITYFIERPLLATDHPLGFSFRWRRRL